MDGMVMQGLSARAYLTNKIITLKGTNHGKGQKEKREMLKLKALEARALGVKSVNLTALTSGWMSSSGDKSRGLNLALPKSRDYQ